MQAKKGFTLLEVLVVVVIAASALLFAVPVYKRTQDKSQFVAAQGLLVELRGAMLAMRQDLAAAGSTKKIPKSTSPVQLVPTYQTSYTSNDKEKDIADTSVDAARLYYVLFAQNYMQPVPFDKDNNNAFTNYYKKYEFYMCPQDTASSSKCCGNNANVIACMYDTQTCSRATKGLYYGARILRDGTIKTFEKTCS